MKVTDSGTTLHHTCFVVRDVEASAVALAESGIGPWGVWTIEPAATTVRGREVPFSFRIAFAFASVGGSSFELLTPLEGESIYVGHLEANGEGFHHTCVAYPTREAMREAKGGARAPGTRGCPERNMGELGEFCYFDIPELGALLELLYVTELPPPERTIG